MGTWGPGIFSNDFASDLREAFRDEIASGASAQEALTCLQKRYSDELADPDEGPVFWLAIAATAWKIGRLEEPLKARALQIIARGEGIDHWESGPPRNKRQQALRELAMRLESPQPAVVKLKKRGVLTNDWAVGEVLGLRLQSGNWTLIHVLDHHQDAGGRSAICELLDWKAKDIPPSQEEVDRARIVQPIIPKVGQAFMLGMLGKPKDMARIARLGMHRRRARHFFPRLSTGQRMRKTMRWTVLVLSHIDAQLHQIFGVD